MLLGFQLKEDPLILRLIRWNNRIYKKMEETEQIVYLITHLQTHKSKKH